MSDDCKKSTRRVDQNVRIKSSLLAVNQSIINELQTTVELILKLMLEKNMMTE